MTRLRYHQQSQDYLARRLGEGLTKREAIRYLKRYIAREVYHHLPNPNPTLDSP